MPLKVESFLEDLEAAKSLEIGEGKVIGDDQIFQAVFLEKTVDFWAARNIDSLAIHILWVNDAHVNLDITLIGLEQGIAILVQDALKWVDESHDVLWIRLW